MWRHIVLAFLAFSVPSLARAQEAPERLLPAGSQIYLHWDGFHSHRAEFDKSALGKTLQGDTGKFLTYLGTYARQTLETAFRNEPEFAEGVAVFDEAFDIVKSIGKHGFIVGIELQSVKPVRAELVLIFPENGPKLMALIDKALKKSDEQPQTSQVGKRTVTFFSKEDVPIHVGWWSEGNDAVFVVGTDLPVDIAKRADGGDPGITKNPLYKTLAGFKDFKTWGRGYVDLASIFGQVGSISEEVDKIVKDLGLDGLKNITLVSGFDGPAEHSVVEIQTTGKRTGLLKLMNRKTISLDDLPPMPDDTTSFSASNFNVASLYEGLIQIVESVAQVVAPGQLPDVREAVKQFEGILGVNLGEDIFGQFEGLSVQYSSPTEGPLGLGAVTMFKVKDEKKLQGSIETLVKAIPALPGVEVKLNKKEYHDVQVLELSVVVQAEFPVLTFCIHKGWFLMANYPQPLYGYILRTKGELPVWKASPEVLMALGQFPTEFTGVAVSDPRGSVKALLAAVPGIITIANRFIPAIAPEIQPFDTSVIPHAADAVRHLFPNVTVTSDDGQVIRVESRTSLGLPLLN